jgi:hypothetical protein
VDLDRRAHGVINQNTPHQARGDSIKVRAIFPAHRFLIHHSEVGFVTSAIALQRVIDPFALEIIARQFAANCRSYRFRFGKGNISPKCFFG